MSKHQIDLTAHIGTLADGLRTASETAWEAYDAAEGGKLNLAIGTLLPIADQLETYNSLCKTILALHRIGQGGAP